jgi:predicted 2-oxoglutarate/Fe(II)-dependent dioxygenase YbiX
MSKRLQVLLPDQELAEIQRLARRDRMAVGEWVRRALREARSRQPINDPEVKLKSIRRAVEYTFPSSDIEQMVHEIEQGYRS